ncbi:MAG: hypothetical protein ACM3X9_10745 [Bacillota bacterium]
MEKADALFEMVAKIAQEIVEIKAEIISNQKENNARFDRIEQKLDTVVEQVAGLNEFKNEITLQFNKLSTATAENAMDIRILKKAVAG